MEVDSERLMKKIALTVGMMGLELLALAIIFGLVFGIGYLIANHTILFWIMCGIVWTAFWFYFTYREMWGRP